MSASASAPAKPTARQLAYLRTLATQTGSTFATPRTRGDASREIDRLRHLRVSRGWEVELPRAGDCVDEPYASAVQPHEVSGYGSSATWRTAAPARRSRRSGVGQLTELARYEAGGARRVVYGQRIDGRVRVTDRPASGAGRSYLVECGLEQDGFAALMALVADYTAQARELGRIPMASSVLTSELEQSAGAAAQPTD
jgi:hypothetical protein